MRSVAFVTLQRILNIDLAWNNLIESQRCVLHLAIASFEATVTNVQLYGFKLPCLLKLRFGDVIGSEVVPPWNMPWVASTPWFPLLHIGCSDCGHS